MEEKAYLNNAVHVRDKAVNSDLEQHDQRSTNVFPHLGVFICSQRKQTLSHQKDTSAVGQTTIPKHHGKSAPRVTSIKVSILSIRA